jgi:hypothetical protein
VQVHQNVDQDAIPLMLGGQIRSARRWPDDRAAERLHLFQCFQDMQPCVIEVPEGPLGTRQVRQGARFVISVADRVELLPSAPQAFQCFSGAPLVEQGAGQAQFRVRNVAPITDPLERLPGDLELPSGLRVAAEPEIAMPELVPGEGDEALSPTRSSAGSDSR